MVDQPTVGGAPVLEEPPIADLLGRPLGTGLPGVRVAPASSGMGRGNATGMVLTKSLDDVRFPRRRNRDDLHVGQRLPSVGCAALGP